MKTINKNYKWQNLNLYMVILKLKRDFKNIELFVKLKFINLKLQLQVRCYRPLKQEKITKLLESAKEKFKIKKEIKLMLITLFSMIMMKRLFLMIPMVNSITTIWKKDQQFNHMSCLIKEFKIFAQSINLQMQNNTRLSKLSAQTQFIKSTLDLNKAQITLKAIKLALNSIELQQTVKADLLQLQLMEKSDYLTKQVKMQTANIQDLETQFYILTALKMENG